MESGLQTIPSDVRRRCADAALHSFGTAYIFEKRAVRIRRLARLLSFFGIAGPASVGAIVASTNAEANIAHVVIGLAALVGLFQLLLAIWSLAAGWNDRLSYYIESKSANYRLVGVFDSLEKSKDLSYSDFKTKCEVAEAEDRLRTDLDNRHDITDKEKRMGLRAALRQYQRPCAGCKQVPVTLAPSNCAVCGKF